MSAIDELRSYSKRLQDRFRLGALVRGLAVLVALALLATLALAFITARFAFSPGSLLTARAVLIGVLALGAALGLALPLRRWGQRWWARRAEQTFPQFGQRLLTFTERDPAEAPTRDPFLELLAADTLSVARKTDVKAAAPDRVLGGLVAAGLAALGILIWLIAAGPGYLGYGASALWTGPKPTPFFQIQVTPGNATVWRHADQLVTAQMPAGLGSEPLSLHVRYQGAKQWEQTPMQLQAGGQGYQFLFAGIPADIEYYVARGSVQSPHFKLHVLDLPAVKQIRVTYHHPDWMHQADTVEEHGGDLRAIAGTEAQLEIHTDRPVTHGVLVLDSGREVALTPAGPDVYRGSITVEKDGMYHVAARETSAGLTRISDDYFIEASPVKPPEVALVRPGHDYRASPIEEVTLAATASDPFGLTGFSLHYSVNGGPDQVLPLMKKSDAGTPTSASGSTVLALENLHLAPGDVVSVYALARDARSLARTDIYFIQIDPFDREFSQSQQMGGGAGWGSQQAQIAQREKEIIGATWQQAGLTNPAPSQVAEQAKFLSEVQSTLKGQAEALSGRLQMRGLQLQNEQFGSFQQDMADAAAAMQPAAQKLADAAFRDAVPDEQKALRDLLHAEATFRQIQVAFASAGTGAVNSAGRDLASLFELELDTQKNEYETAQQATPEQHAGAVDQALQKLDELARRQDALAQHDTQYTAEQRWQEEMLRRKVEQLEQQLQQLAQSAAQGSGQAGSLAATAQAALNRLREGEESMRRAVDQQDPSQAREATQRLREAMNLLNGMQRQDVARQLDTLGKEAARLAREQQQQATRFQGLRTWGSSGGSEAMVDALINDRQQLADDLSKLTGGMRNAERAAQPRDQATARELQNALNDLEQADTETELQASADELRSGEVPLTDAGEQEIAAELRHLQDQLGEARRALASNTGPQQPADKALDAMGRLRSRLAALDESLRQQAQRGQVGQVGEARGGGRGSWDGPVNGAWNTGNNRELPRPVAPATATPAGDPELVFRQGMRDLGQLKRAVGEDPATRRQVDALIRAMEKLDPRRFPGNPAMIDALTAQVRGGVDRLELELENDPEDLAGPVRSDSPAPIPAGYQSAVADYFRRLARNP